MLHMSHELDSKSKTSSALQDKASSSAQHELPAIVCFVALQIDGGWPNV